MSNEFYPGWADDAGKQAGELAKDELKPGSVWSKRRLRSPTQMEESRTRGRAKGGPAGGAKSKARAIKAREGSP